MVSFGRGRLAELFSAAPRSTACSGIEVRLLAFPQNVWPGIPAELPGLALKSKIRPYFNRSAANANWLEAVVRLQYTAREALTGN
jgi:hypothetical protein